MRLPRNSRRSIIVAAAVRQANELGLAGVTQETVAERCAYECSPRTVRRAFPRVSDLWRAVAESDEASAAVKREAKILGVWNEQE